MMTQTVISPGIIIRSTRIRVAGRHRAKGTITLRYGPHGAKKSRFPNPSSNPTEAKPEAGGPERRPKIPIRKRHVRIREQNRSRKPQSQRLGLLVTGIIFHELRALVKFRIGNVTGVHPSDEVARGKKGMTLHP